MIEEPPVTYGLFRVVGTRRYRDHDPGVEFEARLDRNAMRRAVMRGDIELLREIVPELQPGSFTFPDGWLPSPPTPTTRGAERLLTR